MVPSSFSVLAPNIRTSGSPVWSRPQSTSVGFVASDGVNVQSAVPVNDKSPCRPCQFVAVHVPSPPHTPYVPGTAVEHTSNFFSIQLGRVSRRSSFVKCEGLSASPSGKQAIRTNNLRVSFNGVFIHESNRPFRIISNSHHPCLRTAQAWRLLSIVNIVRTVHLLLLFVIDRLGVCDFFHGLIMDHAVKLPRVVSKSTIMNWFAQGREYRKLFSGTKSSSIHYLNWSSRTRIGRGWYPLRSLIVTVPCVTLGNDRYRHSPSTEAFILSWAALPLPIHRLMLGLTMHVDGRHRPSVAGIGSGVGSFHRRVVWHQVRTRSMSPPPPPPPHPANAKAAIAIAYKKNRFMSMLSCLL